MGLFCCRKMRAGVGGSSTSTSSPREEDSFGVYWFIPDAKRWLEMMAVSPGCWETTDSTGLSMERIGPFLLQASCSLPQLITSPELGPGPYVHTALLTRWKRN